MTAQWKLDVYAISLLHFGMDTAVPGRMDDLVQRLDELVQRVPSVILLRLCRADSLSLSVWSGLVF